MNGRWRIGLVALLGVSLAWVATRGQEPLSREARWRQVDEAVRADRPRTAIEHLEAITAEAQAQGEQAEALRAIGRRIALQGSIEGERPEEAITLLQAELETAPAELAPLMQALLAHWQWQYFQRNRWRFMQRTATAEEPGDDITTWDLPRLFAEIDRWHRAALADAEALRAIPIEQFDALLMAGTLDDRYRPTLYDFIAGQAIDFYSSGEQAGARPIDAFVIDAESPVFAPRDAFLEWAPDTPDTDAPLYKAVRLYQTVMRFHHAADNAAALADWDLHRVRFGYNHAVDETKTVRYQGALRRFIAQHAELPISARARHDMAASLRDQGELVQAHVLAEQSYRAFPDTPGGRQCYNLMREIEAPSIAVATERVWPPAGAGAGGEAVPTPEITVRYRNLTAVHFRLVQRDWEADLREQPSRHPEQQHGMDSERRAAILALDPAHAWRADLPVTADYLERLESLTPPDGADPGFYWFIASADPDFGDADNVISLTPVWVSQLALLIGEHHRNSHVEGVVLDTVSGDPVAGATVQLWALAQPWRNVELEMKATTQTAADGRVELELEHDRQHVLRVQHGADSMASQATHRGRRHHHRLRHPHTIFFTDRAIYRPGQTIRFKGILLTVDQDTSTYTVRPNEAATVIFDDVNHKEIGRLAVRSNDHGSFSGSFTAPRDRVAGRMSLRRDGDWPPQRTFLRVEEYKRPTFEVELAAPAEAPALGQPVTLTGTATAYTGAPVDGAEVSWRVTRAVRYPPWWFWRRFGEVASEAREIAHGVARTEHDGTFSITFTARPDPAASPAGEPVFTYRVQADVTDTAGETRGATRTVRAGFTALAVHLDAPDWLTADTPAELAIRTASLDGEPEPAAGVVRIHRLVPPERVQRATLSPAWPRWQRRSWADRTDPTDRTDLSDPAQWPLGEVVIEQAFATDATGRADLPLQLGTGLYRAMAESRDRFGKAVHAERTLRVIDPAADRLALKIPHLFDAPAWRAAVGETFEAVWGSGYDTARALVEIEHRGNILQRYWTEPGRTQAVIRQAVTEELRGGFQVHVTMVHENRAYLESRHVDVPWDNKRLEVTWERFTSKLEPGQREVWTAVVRGPDAELAAAELVATLYDRSLDAFAPHGWRSGFGVFYRDHSHRGRLAFTNVPLYLRHIHGRWHPDRMNGSVTYRRFPPELTRFRTVSPVMMRGVYGSRAPAARMGGVAADMDAVAPQEAVASEMHDLRAEAPPADGAAGEPEGATTPDLDTVTARTDLNETAFFFPHLTTDDDGTVRMEFTMPEALTEWAFLGFAHDRELRGGLLTNRVVTSKDLMVQPNPPRFLREGDVLDFTVRVVNRSDERQAGSVRLTFRDARNDAPFDAALGLDATDRPFDVPAGESRTYAWRIRVPDRYTGVLVYRAVGSSGTLSDGEEAFLPVLSRRIPVTESLPLPIRGPGVADFRFEKLLNAGASDTLEHQSLTLQMVSNPAWYAVMALPYLMEFQHHCSEQVFNRLYANALGRHIANSDPRIRRIFDQWRDTDTLDSPLEQNEDLKSVLIEETPWLRQAENESQARRNVGILFDANRLDDEQSRTLHQLVQMQHPDGSWPWFPGGPPNDFITLYIATGFGRLRHLGVSVDLSAAIRALPRLDGWIHQHYLRIVDREALESFNVTPWIAFYLYGRTFFMADHPIAAEHREAVDYFVEQAATRWVELRNRQSRGHLALALHRAGRSEAAQAIMRSIREYAVTDEELGMFWRDTEHAWWWYRAPIETQALMIEAFDEIMGDAEAVEACRDWLLKQKQTQNWRTTKATADAVYALLLRGTDRLASDALVEVSLGGRAIEPEAVEAGTGFYTRRFSAGEVEPAMGAVTLRKVDEGLAWGSLHWQYLEDINAITPHTATPLTLEKRLYVRRHTDRGPALHAIDGPVAVGDELVTRVVLRTDRDMEYVHLKDHRGSGTEPVNVLSRYRYQDGLRYYETTRDTASHFFIDYLPKGTYVFEYAVRVQHRGRYPSGTAHIQSMYAPEFNSHSGSVMLAVE